jgi:TonB family protein
MNTQKKLLFILCLIAPALADGGNVLADDATSAYQKRIQMWLEDRKVYPESAWKAGEQGQATLRFRIDRAGRVLSHSLTESTGYQDLDDSISGMVDGAVMPPIPKEISQNELELTAAVRFALTEGKGAARLASQVAPPVSPYHSMTGKVFKVDGSSLAAAGAKVSVTGTYMASANNERLWVAGTSDNPVTIGLLTDKATRESRLRFLDCREKLIAYGVYGCGGMTIVGTATLCTRTTLLGSGEDPCIEVDDGFVSNARENK